MLSFLAAGCGARSPDPPVSSPIATDRVTGLEAVEIARGEFPEATELIKVTLSFPRSGGTAEFWSVTIKGSAQVRTIEIQERTVVGNKTLSPDDPAVAGASVRLDVLSFDTAAAETILLALPQVKDNGRSVSISPLAMDLSRNDLPDEALGAPAWEFLVTENQEGSAIHVETIWISGVNGEILATR